VLVVAEQKLGPYGEICLDDCSTTDQTAQSLHRVAIDLADLETERSSRPSSIPASIMR
jgi:hypothetical protein